MRRTAASKAPLGRNPCLLGVRELMAVLAVVGPLGTLISLLVLPQASHEMARTGAPALSVYADSSRVIHLRLAESHRKARYVLSDETGWEEFLSGVQERLHLDSMSRIETDAGETIMSVDDLMHDDQLVVYPDTARPLSLLRRKRKGRGGIAVGRIFEDFRDDKERRRGGGGFYDDGLANGTYARRDEAYRDPPLDPPPAGSNDGDLDLATQLGMDNAFARQQRGQPDWRGAALGGGDRKSVV